MALITINEASDMLRYSPSYMRKLVMLGKIPYVKLGRSVRFYKEDLEKMIQDNYRPVAEGVQL